ncbi:MAG: C10 family peptidase [Prevotella sp.]|nr:C10 family peptidase [Prevotella sp.]
MKNYAILSALLLGAATVQALPRTEAQMMEAAANAINGERAMMHKVPRKGQLLKLAQRSNLSVVGYAEGGFAVVTTDDVLPAVVGYSDKTFDETAMADGFRWWLDAMSEAADYYVATQTPAHIVRPDASRVQPFVRPLLSTEWGQEEPYNNDCPLLPDDELYPRHCVVGCVATATAQILNYHRWPASGHGTTTLRVPYGSPTGTDYFFDFSQCQFDWANMRNTYTPGNYTEAEARAVSQLSHAMGMMAIMQYGIDFSGAISDDAATGLQDYFGIATATLYSRSDVFGMSEKYTEQQWSDMAFQALSNEGPVYYAGADADDQGGHAFVLDGYNEEGLVHVNWGWHGRFDGYYDISLLNPRIYRFSKGQEMILGICPPEKAKGMTHSITVDEPGTLAELLRLTQEAIGVQNIANIIVGGQLNADDVRALAQLTTLSTIDLGNASLVGDALPPQAFRGCANLRSLVLPATMRFYGDGALAGCSNLNSLSLPADGSQNYRVDGGVVYTPDMAEVIAVLPTAPDTVTIADGVTRIHDFAFEGCKYVRIVTLPASVQQLGERSLADVLIMRELHMLGNVPAEAGIQAFDGVDPGFLMLYIPAGSRADYEQAEGWRELFRSDNVTEVGTLIRARDITRQYGEDVDEYYFEIAGQRVKGMPRLWCDATPTSPAGQYVIHCERGSVEGDDVRFDDGLLTVVGGPAGSSSTLDAQASSFTLGYCNGEVASKSQYGDMGNDYVSAAIYIPASTLSSMGGAEIQKIRAGLATRLNIDELSVWIRSELDGDNLAEAQLNRKQTRVQQGWNELSLATPFIIKEQSEGLYVGYTYHHTGLANAVSIVGSTPAGTAFFKKSTDAQWQDVSSEGAISLEAVVSGSMLTQYDLALDHLTIVPDLTKSIDAEGTTCFSATADVLNMGTQTISGFDISIANGATEKAQCHVSQAIESGRRQQVTFDFSLPSTLFAGTELQAAITALDNGTDENAANNTATTAVTLQRHVLIEEFTTEHCPNCPDGAQLMNEAIASKPQLKDRLAVVCHHSAFGTDWLTQPCDEAYIWFFNEGGQTFAPAWMLDRKPYFDSMIASGNRQAIYWTSSATEFAQMLESAAAEEANAQMGATATLAGGTVAVRVKGMKSGAFSLSNPLLTVYLTEDNIAAREQEGAEGPFTHQHVIRACNSTWGEAPSFDRSMGFDYSCELKADPSWKVADLKVVVVLANYDADSNLNCAVENSIVVPVATSQAEGITTATTAAQPGTGGCYNAGGQRIERSHGGLIITRRADGSVVKHWQRR